MSCLKALECRVRWFCVQILAPLLTHCVTSSKLLNFSGLQFFERDDKQEHFMACQKDELRSFMESAEHST